MLDTYEHLGALKGEHTVRKLSISLQLSQYGKDYDGCELLVGNIRPQEKDPILQQGTLIIFPSWVQHKVTKLTRGTRWSWTYWFTGPPWK
jgi:PKHD-type hydroxylase